MSMSRKLKKKLLAAAAALTVMSAGTAYAGSDMPAGGAVAAGEVEVWNAGTPRTYAPGMTINLVNSGNTIEAMKNSLINWQLFNIGPGSNLTFNTNGHVLVNQVPNGPASEIYGQLAQQNGGHLFLINPNGITVASGAQINGTAITLAAVQTLSATQFSDLCAGNPVTLTPAGDVSVKTIYNSVSSEYNVLGQTVSVPDPSYLSMGGTREALSGDTSATLKNNSLTVGGTPPTPPGPTPPGPTPPGPTPDVGPKTEEEAKQFVDQTKGSVDTLTESQRGNDAAVKAAQEALMNAQGDKEKQPTVNDSKLTGVQDHVYVVQTGTEQNNTGLNVGNLFGGGTPITVAEVTTRSKNVAKQYIDAVKSGDTTKTAELKSELVKAREELDEAKAAAELAKQKEAEAAKEAAIKEAQEKLDQAKKDALDKYMALIKARNDLSNAEEKAELAARDYLNALKTGDPEIIAAYKERLQEANDALLEAKRNEEAAQQRLNEADSNIERAQRELNNVQKNFTYSGGAGGENQQTTQQQSGGQQTTQQQMVGQPVQQQSGGETNIITQNPLKAKVTELEQKYNDLTKQYRDGFDARDQANLDYLDAKERGASQEEIDRLKAKYDELAKEQGRILDERKAVKAELEAAREAALTPAEKVAKLEQKVDDLTKQYRDGFDARDQANLDYLDAKERGASQEEIDRLKAKYDELAKEQGRILDERRTAKAELQAAREAANAAETQQQNVEQTTQQQSGGETTTTEQKSAEQSAKDAAVKAAQEKYDQARKEGFDTYDALIKAQHDVSSAEEKAEKAANDYLLALKSGDKYTIDAFKEELQKANDALLEAKRNEEAAQQKIQEVGSNIERARTELDNAQNNFNDSGAAGGETQQTTQQAVEQPTQQQTVEQQSQSQQGEQRTSVVETGGQSGLNIGGSERPVVETETTRPRTGTSQQTMQEKVSVLEQKYKELDETVSKLVSDVTSADVAYMKAEDAGASQEELDRLKAERAQIANKRDAIWEERDAAKAELNALRDQQAEQTVEQPTQQQTVEQPTQQQTVEQPVQQQNGGESNITAELSKMTPAEKVSNLEQKINDLDDKVTDATIASGSALNDYFEAQNRGASQEELDSLKAKYNELDSARDKLDAQRDAAKARLEAAREDMLPPAERAAKLEQKVNDLDDKVTDATIASGSALNDYFEAQNRGASREELDSLKAKYNDLDSARDKLDAQRDDTKARLEAAREDMLPPAERAAKLEQKVNDLDDKVTDAIIASGSALNDYFEAQNRGASQEELDSLKAKYNELDSARDKLDAQRDAAKARLETARAEANAAE